MTRVTHRWAASLAWLITTRSLVERNGWMLLALCCISCSSSDGDSGDNQNTSGVGGGAGVPSAGSGAGGMPTGGMPTGGMPTGGMPTGGMPTGGTPTGGMPTGGAPTAGAGGGGAAGSGPAPRDAAADTGGLDPEADAGGLDVDATTPDASVDAGACGVASATATEAGYLGDWTAGTYPSNFTSGTNGNYLTLDGLPNQAGMDREYAVHVPAGYDGGAPLPALFCLHAALMNAKSFCNDMAGWLSKADEENFILIMPNGYMNTFNIGPLCGAALLPAYTAGLDDVGFARALLEEVGTHVNIDLDRVYATGFSNGSALAWRLACDAADMVAGIVTVVAGPCLETCEPSNKVSVLDIYGGAEILNPTEGLETAITAVQAANGCSATKMPATLPATTGANNCQTWTGCSTDECSPVELTQCIVQNGDHCWYGDLSTADCGPGAADSEFSATNVAWEFLKRLSR